MIYKIETRGKNKYYESKESFDRFWEYHTSRHGTWYKILGYKLVNADPVTWELIRTHPSE